MIPNSSVVLKIVLIHYTFLSVCKSIYTTNDETNLIEPIKNTILTYTTTRVYLIHRFLNIDKLVLTATSITTTEMADMLFWGKVSFVYWVLLELHDDGWPSSRY